MDSQLIRQVSIPPLGQGSSQASVSLLIPTFCKAVPDSDEISCSEFLEMCAAIADDSP